MMLLFYLLLVVLILSKIKWCCSGFYSDYLSFDTTNTIKGVFIFLVFIKHGTSYIYQSDFVFGNDIFSRAFLLIDNYVGQWIVAMFLFYSGYGIMESILKKGVSYILSIPRKRILVTLLNFDIAVLFFAIIALLLETDIPLKVYLLSFTAWESVGNSNWYIFVILLCYLMVYLTFRWGLKSHCVSLAICFLLLFVSVWGLSIVKPFWWYNTMLCFGYGMLYSVWRSPIENIFQKYYWSILFVLTMFVIFMKQYFGGIFYNGYCLAFCALIVMLTMKFKINNSILIWAGKKLFPLYIYQRIPMIIFSSIYGGVFVSEYPVLYMTASLCITLLFAYYYKYWSVKF